MKSNHALSEVRNVSHSTVVETSLSGLKLLGRGKVRDIYEVDGKLLLVASDPAGHDRPRLP